MSHEVETMAWANQVPWHGLGAEVGDDLNSDEFLTAAGLDWTVELNPLFCKVKDQFYPVHNRFGLTRSSDNAVLTVASEHWKPLQNQEVLGFFQNYVTAGAVKLETAGSLRNGKIVWGLAKLNHAFETRPGDRTEGYLLFTSPHQVGSAINLRVTTVRVVCANTMAMALRGKADYSQSHMQPFNFELAREAVAAAHETIAEAERRCKILDGLKMSLEDAVTKVIIPVFEPEIAKDPEAMKYVMDPDEMPSKAMHILYNIVEGPGAIPDTGYGVLNGITHWCDHGSTKDNSSRLNRNWTGDLAKQKLEAEKLLLELAS